MNAVVYARYSSDRQTEQSIEGQTRVCAQYARDKGYSIVGEYIDRASTGRNDDRLEFQKMLKDSYQKNFEIVLVYKLDRFARDRYDAATNRALLRKNGVKLISATEQITDSPEGIILESLLEGMAEYYSAELSQKVKRGFYESVQKGNTLGGHTLYGYKTANKKHDADPEESIVVRKIFDMYAQGHIAREIQKELSPYFTISVAGLYQMLKNKKYTGVYTYRGKDYFNTYPRIIDDALFDDVQRRFSLSQRKRPYKENVAMYYLSGKLVCHCDLPMAGESGRSGTGKIYNYYLCKNKHRISKDWIETAVLKATIDHILNKDVLNPIIDQIMIEYNQSLVSDVELRVLERDLSKVDKELNNLLNALKQGIKADFLQREITRLETQKKELEALVAKRQRGTFQLSRDMILFWFEQFKTVPEEASKQKIFDVFVAKVKLLPDRILILYNHSENNTSELKSSDYEKMAVHSVMKTNCFIYKGFLVLTIHTPSSP